VAERCAIITFDLPSLELMEETNEPAGSEPAEEVHNLVKKRTNWTGYT
jgi:hypothetical protein